jgi:hypothetical protein
MCKEDIFFMLYGTPTLRSLLTMNTRAGVNINVCSICLFNAWGLQCTVGYSCTYRGFPSVDTVWGPDWRDWLLEKYSVGSFKRDLASDDIPSAEKSYLTPWMSNLIKTYLYYRKKVIAVVQPVWCINRKTSKPTNQSFVGLHSSLVPFHYTKSS